MLVVGFVIAAVLLTAEYLLCTKLENPLWGGMIPLFLLAGTVWLFASGRIPLETRYVFPFVILNAKLYKGRKQTVKRAADNKRRYAPGEGSIPPVLLSGGFQRGAPFGTRLCLQSVVCYTCWRG